MDYQNVLSKVRALIDSPNLEEAKTARELYNKLKTKYNLEDVTAQETEKEYKFKVGKTPWKRQLFNQVVYAVTGKADVAYFVHQPSVFVLKTTDARAFEIEYMFDFYKKLFEKDVKIMLMAFIQKHRILPPDAGTTDEVTPEILKAAAMIKGLSDEECNFHKAIESDID